VDLPYARDSHNRSQLSAPLPIVLLFVLLKVRPEFGALDAASLTDEQRIREPQMVGPAICADLAGMAAV
jgi:hypothetical protein